MATTTAKPLPHLTVSALEQEPFLYRDDPDNQNVFSGFMKDLLDEIAKKQKFTYDFMLTSDHKYGSNAGGEGWTGIMGDIVEGRANVSGAALTVTKEREAVADFTKPFMTESVNLLVHKPTWYDMGLAYLTRPFSSDYWILLLVALLVVGIILFLIGKFSPYEWGNTAADRDPRGARNAFSLRNSYLFAFSTLTWQGFREPPRSLSGRLMAAFWWIFVLFTLVAYTANLTAFMLARKEMLPDMPFKTIEDLLTTSDISTGVLEGGSTQSALRNARQPSLRNLFTLIDNKHTYESSYDEAAVRVARADGSFVMIMETSTALYHANRNCELMVYGDDLFPSQMAFAMPKGSYWRTKFNEAIGELKADGVIQQLQDKYWKYGKCGPEADGREMLSKGGYMSKLPVYPVSLKDMSVAILFFFLGIVASIIALIIEIVHFNVTKKGKKLHRPGFVKDPKGKAQAVRGRIFKPKPKPGSKPASADVEQIDESGAGASQSQQQYLDDDDANMENVPLSPQSEQEAEDAEIGQVGEGEGQETESPATDEDLAQVAQVTDNGDVEAAKGDKPAQA